MQHRPLLAAGWSTGAVVATVLALGGFGAGFGSADGLITAGFTSALDRSTPPQSTRANLAGRQVSTGETGAPSGLAQLSGSEEFWLDRTERKPGTVPVVWSKTVAKGDRITIASHSGELQLEVVDIRPIGERAADADAGAAASQPLLLVTCQDVAARSAPPVRFVIESGRAAGLTSPRAAHAL